MPPQPKFHQRRNKLQIFGNNLSEIDIASSRLYKKIKDSPALQNIQLKSILGKPQINKELNYNKILNFR